MEISPTHCLNHTQAAQCSLLRSPFLHYDLDGSQLTSCFLATGGTSSYSPWPVGGARLDKPGINAAPVSRLLTRPGLILPALCRAFLSLAPRLSLGAGLADRIGHASQLILTLEAPGTSSCCLPSRKSEQVRIFHSAPFPAGQSLSIQTCKAVRF